jgi:NADH-ubiquinone oxidoreductase chain 5
MYLILIFLPFISSITVGMFGKKLGTDGSSFISVFSLFFTFISSLFCFYEVGLSNSFVFIKLLKWIDSDLLQVDWGFLFDSLTVVMCCVITFISFLVHLYSTEYMSHDPHLPRFMSYLSLFTFFMLILVTADNYVQMFVGWEGVGLCSYLLINFWFTRIQANKAAIKAMIVNRIGDFGLILAILVIFINFKALDYATIFSLIPFYINEHFTLLYFEFNLLSVISFFLFVGAIGKSAQLGLHTWLPDAMEGPTPVSALIHAATMVTAGVFLIVRSSCLFEYSLHISQIVTILGASTAFFAASIGLLQNDLKRVIAYSTCSQLGYMIFACGLSNYSVGIFHLANHAFFKALLFLAAGSVIHAIIDEQDMRKMGGLKNKIPFTYSIMVIGSLALIGFPFLTGFYSKDVILELAYGKFSTSGYFSYILGTCGAFFTSFYSTRLLYLTFLSKPNAYKSVLFLTKESMIYPINIVLALLAIPSIFIGYYLKDMLIGLGSDFWGNSIYVLPENMNRIDAEFINQCIKLLPLMLTFTGFFFAFIFYTFFNFFLFNLKVSNIGKKIYNFLNKKWFFDKIYNEYLVQNVLNISYRISYKIIDRGIIEIFGPLGLTKIVSKKAVFLYKLQSGFLYHYTLIVLIASTFSLLIRQICLQYEFLIDFKISILFFLFIFYFIALKNKF